MAKLYHALYSAALVEGKERLLLVVRDDLSITVQPMDRFGNPSRVTWAWGTKSHVCLTTDTEENHIVNRTVYQWILTQAESALRAALGGTPIGEVA